MSALIADLGLALIASGTGLGLGWWMRSGVASRHDASRCDDEAKRGQEALAKLHELATHVAADVGAHNTRVQEINAELNASDKTDSDVISAVTKLIKANERMQQQLASTEKKLEEQKQQTQTQAVAARTDALTGVANRRAFDDDLAKLAEETDRAGTANSLVMIDVDFFKKFNDTHGHQAGDEVLKLVARTLRNSARPGDIVARYGGEEFSIIFPGTTAAQAAPLVERARLAIEAAGFEFNGTTLKVTASAGLAQIIAKEGSAGTIRRADEGLYKSKQSGRNCGFMHDGRTLKRIGEAPAAPKPVAVTKPATVKPAEVKPVEVKLPEQKPVEVKPEPKVEAKPAEVKPVEAKPADVSADADFDPRTDPLTGLSSRQLFTEDVSRRLAEWRRGGTPLAVMLVEVDEYTRIVARYGHHVGEQALVSGARLVRAAVREMDHVARYGGETFAVLLPSAQAPQVVAAAERLRQAISLCPVRVDGQEIRFSVSIGVAEAISGDDGEGLMRRCEMALDSAIEAGRNRCHVHNGAGIEGAEWYSELTA